MIVKELYCDQLARQQVRHYYQNFRLKITGADSRVFLLMKEELYSASRDILQIPTYAYVPEKGIHNPLFEDFKLDVAESLKNNKALFIELCRIFVAIKSLPQLTAWASNQQKSETMLALYTKEKTFSNGVKTLLHKSGGGIANNHFTQWNNIPRGGTHFQSNRGPRLSYSNRGPLE